MNHPTYPRRLEMTLEDRLTLQQGWVYLTGMQALVRLPLQQRYNDNLRGFDTGGFISGYRGSPMGRYDMELWRAGELLKENNIVFVPGVNEELAATAAWGTQYLEDQEMARVDGVFSIWYGKGPGVDRALDALRHANHSGTSRHGGILALAGDDHAARSSTVVNFSDINFVSAGIPVLYPANAQDVLDFGLHGIAMSRYSGCVVGMKLVTDVIEGGRSVEVTQNLPAIELPEQQPLEAVGWAPLVREQRLFDIRLPDAVCYARLNGLDRVIHENPDARIGIVTAGKAYQDVEQGLRQGGYRDGRLGSVALSILKLGLIWPIDPEAIRAFCQNIDMLIVVEEKRPLIEDQLRSILYEQANQPVIIGKRFANGEPAFPSADEITPDQVLAIITRVAHEHDPDCGLSTPQRRDLLSAVAQVTTRVPSYCPGCPHGRSTQVIDGSRALGGIGCHSMAVLIDPVKTSFFSQMGGEGAMWIGQSPFTDEKHVFTNMGDGTYFHSGILAIRAAVAANIPITYKLLYNGFVSMTGGQVLDGEISVPRMIEQLHAEGVGKICLVSDEPAQYSNHRFPASTSVHPREEFVFLEKQLRDYPGVSVLLFDQPCATERRRLRKRGQWAEPDERVFINSEVCEGCGDCSTISGCMAIEPLETPLGRKRRINQSSCNKDFSCLEGFCPALVTVTGATPRKHNRELSFDTGAVSIPEPQLPAINGSYAVLVAGIGGAGVVTVGQTLALAAHLDGGYSSNLDVTGLAQKYGAVHSHIKIARYADNLLATRVAAAEADALIGCDIVVAATDESLKRANAETGRAVVDTMLVPTSDFSRNPDWQLDRTQMLKRIDAVFQQRVEYFEVQRIAQALLGDAIYANTMLLGASWQQGALPLSKPALLRAIELNGVAVETNIEAFELGRLLIHDRACIESVLQQAMTETGNAQVENQAPEKLLDDRKTRLVAYQDEAYAERYARSIERLAHRCRAMGRGEELVAAATSYYYKLLAFKDGWEIARLHSDQKFSSALSESFDGEAKLKFYIGSWPFARRNSHTGEITKRVVGAWLQRLFKLMAPLRFLRGSLLDPFRYSDEGKLARQLIEQYEDDMQLVHDRLTESNIGSAIRLLSLPEHIRGFGHVRVRHVQALSSEREILLNALQAGR